MRLSFLAGAAALGLSALGLSACIGVRTEDTPRTVYVVPQAAAPAVVCANGTQPPCP